MICHTPFHAKIVAQNLEFLTLPFLHEVQTHRVQDTRQRLEVGEAKAAGATTDAANATTETNPAEGGGGEGLQGRIANGGAQTLDKVSWID